MKYSVIVTTLFFITVFIVFLDDLFVATILPNTSLTKFLTDFAFGIGALIASLLNLISGILELELRVAGLLSVIIKLLAYMGVSLVDLLSDLLLVPFVIIGAILDATPFLSSQIKAQFFCDECDVRGSDLTRPVKEIFSDINKNDGFGWLAVDFTKGEISMGLAFRFENDIDIPFDEFLNIIGIKEGDLDIKQKDRLWFSAGIELPQLRFFIDAFIIIPLEFDMSVIQILRFMLQFTADQGGTFEDVFWKEIAGG